MNISGDNSFFQGNIDEISLLSDSPLHLLFNDLNPFIIEGNDMQLILDDLGGEKKDHEVQRFENYGNIIKSNKSGVVASHLFEIKNKSDKDATTLENSNQNAKEKIIIIPEVKNTKKDKFQIKRPDTEACFRFDSAKKYWKSNISQFLTNFINQKIEGSDLPKALKKKIHKPNSKLFTSNVKESANHDFLKKDLREIFTIGKKKEYNNLQEKNGNNIKKIYDYFRDNNLSYKMLEIKNFFEMSYEDLIKKFYESDEFNNFKTEEKTQFYDKETKKQEGFVISEELGLIKLFNRKRERD